MTDPDCSTMKGRQGTHVNYNVQSVVDDGNGLILNADGVRDTNDLNQFTNQIDNANEIFDKPCDVAYADIRMFKEELKEKFEMQYEQESSQKIYERRKCKVEHTFGFIKTNLNINVFMHRGHSGVQVESSLFATCFNLTRLINLFIVPELINAIQT